MEAGEDPSGEDKIFKYSSNLARQLGTSGCNFVSNLSDKYYNFATGKAKKLGPEDSWFAAFGNSNKAVGINVYVDNPDFGSRAFINRRIDKNGKFLGVISTALALDDFVQKVSSMKIGERGMTAMVDPEGLIRLHQDKKAINKLNIRDIKGYENDVSSLLKSKSYQFSYTDENGETWYVVSRYIPELNWYLITKASKSELFAEVNHGLYVTFGVALLFLVFGMAVGALLVRSITTPLKNCVQFADKVAGGDLNATAPKSREDELGLLSGAMVCMVGELNNKISEADEKSNLANSKTDEANKALAEAEEAKEQAFKARSDGLNEAADRLESVVNSLSSTSEELSAQTVEIVRGTDVQNSRMEETAASMEQMNNTVMEVARNSSSAADNANTARNLAVDGQDTVRMRKSLGELGEQADSIGSIIDVINDIADQTNLLALNAAIEAARAGEAGRGFAVVADEVRKLAEKTMAATTEVGSAIHAIQGGTQNNIKEMEGAENAVKQYDELARQAEEALVKNVEVVTSTTDQVSAIATAAEEQSAASEEIGNAVEEVNQISSETAQGMTQTQAAINELTEMASQLREMTEDLRAG
nr:methyl-accepting chemotaxis protein [Desulfovibrio sp. JC022]